MGTFCGTELDSLLDEQPDGELSSFFEDIFSDNMDEKAMALHAKVRELSQGSGHGGRPMLESPGINAMLV